MKTTLSIATYPCKPWKVLRSHRINETSGRPSKVYLTLNFYADPEAKFVREQYAITPNSFGPFTDLTKAELKEKMMLVQNFDIEYRIRNEVPTASLAESDCYDWAITQHYEFNLRSEIRLSIRFYKLPCGYSRLKWR
jgi:hypothetical protein